MRVLVFIFFFSISFGCLCQTIPTRNSSFEEYFRRQQLHKGFNEFEQSFTLRPLNNLLQNSDSINFHLGFTPFYSTSEFNSNRPYGWGNGIMLPNTGLQQYFSGGLFFTSKFFEVQFQPEIVFSQNRSYFGFQRDFNTQVLRDRFYFWNFDDTPERFGDGILTKIAFGQSKAVLKLKNIEIGISTQNIWWGPGQWNALTFSRNAQGFPHLTFNSRNPLKTIIGNFESQILIGRLENSGIAPSQFNDLNQNYFNNFNGDWRYLNAMMITYNPKWIPGLFFGFNRTYQQYNNKKGKSFREFFPIFDPFQKEEFGFDRDDEERDQQASVFVRFVTPKAKAEVYFEYGRRDHAFNWREAIINPEHARAYLIGFKKLFDLPQENKIIQVRGEITHQQESINRYIRYRNLTGGVSWHTHGSGARGFVQYGQPLGVGIGTGSNVQTLEVSLVEKFNKMGILFERLENHQDFYYRAFGQQKEHQPWVDLSVGFLFNKQWNNLLLSSKLQLINGINYQWQLTPDSTPEYPKGENLFTVHSQVSLIYLVDKGK